ncbi:unnamed protein product, partial [Rhizoctonia solani]
MSGFTLRWGILATGGIAEAFAKDLLVDPAARDTHDVAHNIVAVGSSSSVDKSKEFITKVGADSSVIACGSYEELVNIKEVDIVYIATPHRWVLILTSALRGLTSRQPSLREWPSCSGSRKTCAVRGESKSNKAFTVNARQAAHLAKVAQSKNLFLMEAVWTRFFPISKEIQRLIHEEKVLGDIRRVFADLAMVFKRDPNSRLYNPDLAGGALLDLGIYPFTWAFMTLYDHPDNQKTKPDVTANILKSQLTPIDETTSATLTFPKLHATAHVTCSMTNQTVSPYPVTIQGEKGELQVAPFPYRPEQFVLRLYGQEPKTYDYKIPGQGLFWEADECARQIRDGKLQSERFSLKDSIAFMEVLDEVRRQGGLTKRPLVTQSFAMNRLALHSARSIVRLVPATTRYLHSSPWALKPFSNSSINPDEIAHFSRLSSQWWDESDGAEFALLHRMNPVRVRWILEKLEEARKDDTKGEEWVDWRSQANMQAPKTGRQLEGMSVLDIGCGGGLLSETLSRLGARTTGIDASQNNIHIATLHASQDPSFVSGENQLEYQHTSAEALVGRDAQFDVVCAMEVVEHVDNPAEFLRNCGKLVKPGGHLFMSTISRTPISYFLTVLMAERVLGLVERGTHTHSKYVNPSELVAFFRDDPQLRWISRTYGGSVGELDIAGWLGFGRNEPVGAPARTEAEDLRSSSEELRRTKLMKNGTCVVYYGIGF